MRKLFTCLFIIGLVLFSFTVYNSAETVSDSKSVISYEYLKARTVYIAGTAKSEDRAVQWAGTGVVVKKTEHLTYILTNNHVAGWYEDAELDALAIYVQSESRYIRVTSIIRHKLLDMAVIIIEENLADKVAITEGVGEVFPSNKVFVVGHHLGRKYVYGEGVFAGYDGLSGIIQVPVCYGNSGSGVFDIKGRLVGLVFAISGVNNFCVDVSHGLIVNGGDVKAFLNTMNLP